ncbi:MAG: PEP-CTERM sorting domain-containing protein [Armatimonadota bacterium]|nr:PEP-CTERM sorting domain-containing protein [Armatimonadota bacterium]
MRGMFVLRMLLAGLFLLVSVIPGWSAPRYDDLWDIAKGAVVTASSNIYYGSNARNMLGAFEGWIEAGQGTTLFADDQVAGYVHWVRWSVPADVTVGGFDLYAGHDGINLGRSFDHFTLLAVPAGQTNWVVIFDTDIPVPYPHTGYFEEPLLSAVFAQPITARDFEARFRQHTNTQYAKGPRVIELDGLEYVPEPGSAVVLGSALAAVAALRRRRV